MLDYACVLFHRCSFTSRYHCQDNTHPYVEKQKSFKTQIPLDIICSSKKRNDHEDQLTGKVLHLYLLSNFLNNILVIRIGTILIILECIKMHDI